MKIFVLLTFLFFSSTSFTQSFYDWMLQNDSIATLWVKERIANAQKGEAELVSFPLAVRSLGWGCLCPDYYIGINPNMAEGPWIYVHSKRKFPECTPEGSSLSVEGFFTGKHVEVDLRNEDGEPAEWLYIVPEFEVTRFKKNKKGENSPAPRVISE